MNYKSVKDFSQIWGISTARIRKLCQEGRISGVQKKGKLWLIPENTQKPKDNRFAQQYSELFTEIENYKNKINKWFNENPPLSELEQKRLRESFIIENTYNTNAIEGNTMTLQETAWVLEGITIDKKPIKEHLELIGHKEAFEWIETMVKENQPISEALIKNIHSLVLMNRKQDAGTYRSIPVYISGSNCTPVQPYLIESKMQELITKYKKITKNKHIIECISIFHLMFEEIHPFIDGNGRTGRLLINYELMRNKYMPIDIKYKDVKKYYEAFSIYQESNKKDISAMVYLIGNYVLNTLKNFENIIIEKRSKAN